MWSLGEFSGASTRHPLPLVAGTPVGHAGGQEKMARGGVGAARSPAENKKLRPGLLVPGGAHWPKSGNRSPFDLSTVNSLDRNRPAHRDHLGLRLDRRGRIGGRSSLGAAVAGPAGGLRTAARLAAAVAGRAVGLAAAAAGAALAGLLRGVDRLEEVTDRRRALPLRAAASGSTAARLAATIPGVAGRLRTAVAAPQAGSAQPLPAPQAGSAQPFPAPHAGSQQPVQLRCFRLHFSNRPFSPPKRSCFLNFRTPQHDDAPQAGSQQPLPASQAGSAQPLPAPQAGSAQPLPAPQPGSQAPAQPLPAPQSGSQHEVQPLWPSILFRSSNPKDWLQTVTPRTSAPRNIIRFIEPHLLCLQITRESTSRSRGSSPRGCDPRTVPRQACRAIP